MKALALIGSCFQNENSEECGSFLFYVWLIGMSAATNEMTKTTTKRKITKGFES